MMNLSTLLQKPKMQLVAKAWQRGPRTGLQQSWLGLLDSMLRKRHMVFRIEAADLLAKAPPPGKEQIHEITHEGQIPEHLKPTLSDPMHDWGQTHWLTLGWHLWLLEDDQGLAAAAWIRGADQSKGFFVPLGESDALFWHVYVWPDFRGRGLQQSFWAAIAARSAATGITAFFTNCRDYNLPSRRNILKLGFACIGHSTDYRFRQKQVWRSTAP